MILYILFYFFILCLLKCKISIFDSFSNNRWVYWFSRGKWDDWNEGVYYDGKGRVSC